MGYDICRGPLCWLIFALALLLTAAVPLWFYW